MFGMCNPCNKFRGVIDCVWCMVTGDIVLCWDRGREDDIVEQEKTEDCGCPDQNLCNDGHPTN